MIPGEARLAGYETDGERNRNRVRWWEDSWFAFLELPAELGSFGKTGWAGLRGGFSARAGADAKCPKLGLGSFGITECRRAWRPLSDVGVDDSGIWRSVRISYLFPL
jgi:hypothetical protein